MKYAHALSKVGMVAGMYFVTTLDLPLETGNLPNTCMYC